MKLNLEDIEEYVKKHNIRQVSTVRVYERPNKLDETGLFSELVFGRIGSTERRKTFGYIDLKCKILHPEVYGLVVRLDPLVSKFISQKGLFNINETGDLIETTSETGINGIHHFCNILPTLNLKNMKNQQIAKFIKQNMEKIIISKILILPAGIRDLKLSKMSGKSQVQFAEVNGIYESIIKQTHAIPSDLESLPPEFTVGLVQNIQRKVLEVNEWIKSKMKGKSGLIRGGLLKKVVDYSARLVIVSDPTLKLGYLGLPWQVILKLYEPFSLHYFTKRDLICLTLIQDNLNISSTPDINDLKRFIQKINDDPTSISELLKDHLINAANDIIKDKIILYKRDPVESRDSYMSANIRVDRESYVARVTPLDLPKCGGD